MEERTESHNDHWEAKAHERFKELSPPSVSERQAGGPKGGYSFEMDRNAETGGWKGKIRANDQLGRYPGRQIMATKIISNLLISHHTAPLFSTVPAQSTASTPNIIFETKSQQIIESVATLPARQCQGMVRRSEKAAKKAEGASSGCIEDARGGQ